MEVQVIYYVALLAAVAVAFITFRHAKFFIAALMGVVALVAAVITYLIGDTVYAVVFGVSGMIHLGMLDTRRESGFGSVPVHRPWQMVPDMGALRKDRREAAILAIGCIALTAVVLAITFTLPF